ncbi:MAG: hypothetical protein ACRDDA_13235 [Aeromonas sp.]
MKRLVLALACAAALVGCGDDVSGKYAGTWSNGGTTYTIADKGDHYDLNMDSRSFGKMTFAAKEDADGYLTEGSSGVRHLNIKDANTITSANGSSVYKRVK